MSIYPAFTPTYLYIKQHTVTGKLYFGKSQSKTVKQLLKYTGSGTHWTNHIKKHGKENVITLWYCLFFDQESLTEFAINFSLQQNIVESTVWLNLKIEDGRNNGTTKHSTQTKDKISKANTGRKFSAEINAKKALRGSENGMHGVHRFGKDAPNYGKKHSAETKSKISLKAKNREKKTCPHCGKICDPRNATRHHFDNCIKNPNLDKATYLERKMIGRVCRLFDRKEMDCGNWAIWIKSLNQT